jgi:CRISPR/Cas system CMR subunit Cmr6 (Cas7 group RAMP superfamily)
MANSGVFLQEKYLFREIEFDEFKRKATTLVTILMDQQEECKQLFSELRQTIDILFSLERKSRVGAGHHWITPVILAT